MSPKPSDHPRSRGVYSRPRFRNHWAAWIIPARAGFTLNLLSPTLQVTDHPRSRGVYVTACTRIPATCGSSPLARGLHGGIRRTSAIWRIIPARAGFTGADTF